jgi:hypothetical protein
LGLEIASVTSSDHSTIQQQDLSKTKSKIGKKFQSFNFLDGLKICGFAATKWPCNRQTMDFFGCVFLVTDLLFNFCF